MVGMFRVFPGGGYGFGIGKGDWRFGYPRPLLEGALVS